MTTTPKRDDVKPEKSKKPPIVPKVSRGSTVAAPSRKRKPEKVSKPDKVSKLEKVSKPDKVSEPEKVLEPEEVPKPEKEVEEPEKEIDEIDEIDEVEEPEKKVEEPTGVERDTPGAPPEKEKQRHSIEVQEGRTNSAEIHTGSGDDDEGGLSSGFVNKMFQKYVVAKQR